MVKAQVYFNLNVTPKLNISPKYTYLYSLPININFEPNTSPKSQANFILLQQ